MKITMLAKDRRSGAKNCPSVYVADTGELVVQGVELTESEAPGLKNVLNGESAVRIDPAIVIEALAQYETNTDQQSLR